MTIQQRLYAFIVIVVAGLVSIAGVGISQMAKVYDSTNYTNVNTVPSLLTLADAAGSAAQLRTQLWQYMALNDPEKRAVLSGPMDQVHAKTLGAFDKYEKENLSNDEDKALLNADRAALNDYDVLLRKIKTLVDNGRADEARDLLFANQAVGLKVPSTIETHRQFNAKLGKEHADEASATAARSNWLSMIIAAVITAVVATMGILLTKNLINALKEAVKVAETVAGGDLTYQIVASSKDETGRLLGALKAMSDNLAKIVGQVRIGTDEIVTASSQIANGNLDLSSRTEEQASSLEETASSMEELTSTVQQNDANAQSANALAALASDAASKGGAVVSHVITTMSSIDASARKIEEIISVIDGIAFQTNILALNAAVEAARAGEQGRGFAVVAGEVRNLAHRSAAAAKEIKALITHSVEQVDAGNKLVSEAGAAMDNVVDSVKRVSTIIGEITMAGREQSSGIEQINQAISQMDAVTQQNAALVEEAAAAAASLQNQATTLSSLVSTFKVDSTGTMKSAAAVSPRMPVHTEKPTLRLGALRAA